MLLKDAKCFTDQKIKTEKETEKAAPLQVKHTYQGIVHPKN